MRQKPKVVRALFLFAFLTLVVSGSVFAQEATKKIGQWRENCARCKKMHEPTPTVNKCNEFIFDSTKSYDPNNKKISVNWDFGDGTTSTERVVKHIYEKSGAYTATLTVTNNTGVTCDTDVSKQNVVVNTPPVCEFTAPEGACAGQEVTLDASSTTGNMANEMTYNWDFGDGTKETGKTVKHAYQNHGTYRVRLMVDDNAKTACSTCSTVKTIVVNSPPIAVAGKDRELCLSGNEAMKVHFDGSGSHDPNSQSPTYVWDFGDGTTETGIRVSHEYAKPGIYNVKLTVSDTGLSACNMATDNIKVSIFKGPSANAGEDTAACVGESVSFNGTGTSGSGSELKYRWDFGDGTSAEGATAAHAYMKGGTYRAVLYVDDGTGSKCSSAMDAREVVIGAPPVAKLADVQAACTGERVMLDASGSSSSGGSLKYTWDFGDGTGESGGSRVSHVYENGGQYTVRVTVERVGGSSCAPVKVPCSTDSASTTVKVSTRPVANAGPNTVCCIGKEHAFDGSQSSGNNLTYSWDFGDGTKAEGVKVQHTYDKGGSYKVVLTVDDNSGSKCSKSSDGFVAHVFEQPVSIIQVR